MSSGLYSHTTRGIGTVLTAAIYNADHNNHITNANPSQHGGYSDSVPEMQTMVNPGEVGTEILASSLAGEIARLRYVINRIAGTTHWYEAPVTSLAAIGGGIPLTLAFASTPLNLRRTENDTTAREILSLGSGSGVGNKFGLQMVGTGANAAAELRLLLAAVELFRLKSESLELTANVDLKEKAAPATPGTNIARIYAREINTTTKLCFKDDSGAEFVLRAGARAYDEHATYSTISTVIPLDDTVPLISEGTEILSAAITLQKANSKVRVAVDLEAYSNATVNCIVAVFRGTLCIGTKIETVSASIRSISVDVEDTPGTVGPHTYSVRVGPHTGTIWLNGTNSGRFLGGSTKATLFLEENPV